MHPPGRGGGFSVPVVTVTRARLHIKTAINVCRHLKPSEDPRLPAGKKRQQLAWISSEKMQLQASRGLKSVHFPKAFIEPIGPS